MSENETQQVQADATGELAESELESVAGGETIIERAVDGVVDTINRVIDIFT